MKRFTEEKLHPGTETFKESYSVFHNRIVAGYNLAENSLNSLSELYTIREGVDKDFKEFKELEIENYQRLLLLLSTPLKQQISHRQFEPEYRPTNGGFYEETDWDDIYSISNYFRDVYNIPAYLNERAENKISDMEVKLVERIDNNGGGNDLRKNINAILDIRKDVVVSGAQRDAIRGIIDTVRKKSEPPEFIKKRNLDWELIPEIKESISYLEKNAFMVKVIKEVWEQLTNSPEKFFHDQATKRNVNVYSVDKHIRDWYIKKDGEATPKERNGNRELPKSKETIGKQIGAFAILKFWERAIDENFISQL